MHIPGIHHAYSIIGWCAPSCVYTVQVRKKMCCVIVVLLIALIVIIAPILAASNGEDRA